MDIRPEIISTIPKDLDLLMVLGPTASGKTKLAIQLALHFNGEIISADSRQVYKRMDIGTGKDLGEYHQAGVYYHLIDIMEPGQKFNLSQFQSRFEIAYKDIKARHKLPIVCGGTGLYLESILSPKLQTQIPENQLLRDELEKRTHEELRKIWNNRTKDMRQNKPDLSTKKRCIRALEIAAFLDTNPLFSFEPQTTLSYFIIGLNPHRDLRRTNIEKRLALRLKNGLIQEVEQLLAEGLGPEMLDYYGLEYKFIGHYLQGKISYDDLSKHLCIAIQQYAKRQMTWFRKMNLSFPIHWINLENINN